MIHKAIRLVWISVVAFVPCSFAQTPDASVIHAVELLGLERVSEQLVRSQLEVQAGQTYSPRAVARDLRRLYELGLFATIKADLDSSGGRVTLTYLFEEERIIDRVEIQGSDKIKAREIRSILSWREGDAYVEEGYDEEREAILGLYASKGFLNAVVDITVQELSSSLVQITYAIEEGNKARIRKVLINGNTVLSNKQIKKLIKTKPSFLFLGGRYDQRQFEADLSAIIEEYGNLGRLEADILGTEFLYSRNGKKVDISINVEEGPEYTLDTLEFANNVVFGDDELVEILAVQWGDIHNRGAVEDDARNIQALYEDNGYVNARALPQVTLNRENKTTHVVHNITEGALKYIREIQITGNSVTRDDVIRRRLVLSPGDRFDGSALRASRNRLESTQFFDEVRMTLQDVETDERFTNVLVDVVEGRTGTFNFGAGFSTDENFGGFAEIRLSNFDITNWPTFSGGGQQLSTRFSLGDVRTQFSISFTDPEIGGMPFSFGFDLFNESINTTGGSSFTEDTKGLRLRFGKALSPFVTISAGLGFTDVDIDDLGDFGDLILSPTLNELRNPGTTISTSFGIRRNTLNHFRDPSAGADHNISLEVAALGDNEFVKLEHDSIWYWALDKREDWILSYRTREGIAEPFGSSSLVPLQNRFFAGGTTTIRGFDTRDVGPKERTFLFFGEKERIGGEVRLINNLELKYKVTDILRLYGFLDAGAVWRSTGHLGVGDLKASAGFGIGMNIPRMGPMRVDFGFPLNPDSDQGSGRLHFTSGLRF